MPLTESQNAINAKELAEIRQAIITETAVATKQHELKMLDELIKVTLRTFGHKDLLLSDVGKQSLAFLLFDAMQDYQDGKTRIKKKYKADVQVWIDETYPALIREADAKLKRLLGVQPKNLKSTLLDESEVPVRVWGDDNDIRTVLGRELVVPEAVAGDGIYILPPVSVVAGAYASEQESESPHIFLQDHLQTVCKNNPDKAMTVLVPVNSGNLHWMLFKAEIVNGRVEHAAVIDSMLGASNTVLHNVSKATKTVGCDRVKTVARYVQTNGYSCMDFTIQKALQEKYKSVDDVPDASLQAVYEAEDAGRLRGAIVDTIIQRDARLANNKKLVTAEASKVFTRDVKPKLLQEVLHAALTCPADKTISHMVAENTRDLQIKFDELLAKKLDELYKDVANECKSDAELFDQARVTAYQEAKQKFALGLFAVKEEKAPEAKSGLALPKLPGCVIS